mmetsp:Transcript_3566/g.5394  ORF Transcript_3566/g.5394 Transcript_3566/m.5394 type:complete len:191 (-) Transcript_3566:402-974(-)
MNDHESEHTPPAYSSQPEEGEILQDSDQVSAAEVKRDPASQENHVNPEEPVLSVDKEGHSAASPPSSGGSQAEADANDEAQSQADPAEVSHGEQSGSNSQGDEEEREEIGSQAAQPISSSQKQQVVENVLYNGSPLQVEEDVHQADEVEASNSQATDPQPSAEAESNVASAEEQAEEVVNSEQSGNQEHS